MVGVFRKTGKWTDTVYEFSTKPSYYSQALAMNLSHSELPKIGVVIPAYKVKDQIIWVINKIGGYVCRIYVVDDCCPQQSGAWVENQCTDERVQVITHVQNQGVGGALITGYKAALEQGMEIVVKVDGDGQMDPELIATFIAPILAGDADYTKGNRFFDLDSLDEMPKVRLFGNAILSFMNKLSSGYWDVFDPTNGYTAIHTEVLKHLPLEKISRRYFFESDMLFRLSTLRAVVVDIPMQSKYGEEVSNLKIKNIMGEFLFKNIRNMSKRIFYNYYLRGLSVASLELPIGIFMLSFGVIFGVKEWLESYSHNLTASAGTVMLASLPIILGVQFLLAFLNYDINSVPKKALHLSKLRIKEIHSYIGEKNAR